MTSATTHSPVLLLVLVLAGTLSDGLAKEGRVVMDWSGQVAGSVPVRPDKDIYFSIRYEANVQLVNSTTTPATPFEGDESALFVGSGESKSSGVAVSLNPFFNTVPPSKGWVDIEFALQKGSRMNVTLGVDSPVQESPGVKPKYEGQELVSMVLSGDNPSSLLDEKNPGGPSVKMEPPVTSMVPHVLRIEWDWTQDPGLRFSIDKKPLLDADGRPFFLAVPPDTVSQGVDVLRIYLRSGSFLRKVTASE